LNYFEWGLFWKYIKIVEFDDSNYLEVNVILNMFLNDIDDHCAQPEISLSAAS